MAAPRRRRVVVDQTALAQRIGDRIRTARLRAGLTQQQLAGERYTKAYISALEKGHAKPSMAALDFIAERLGLPASAFIETGAVRWSRLEADILLSSGSWRDAADAYEQLLGTPLDRPARGGILAGLAEARCRLDQGREAIAPAAEAVEVFTALRREHDALLAGYWLANAHFIAQNDMEARSILSSSLDRIRDGLEVEPDVRMRFLVASAAVENAMARYEAARAFLEEARALAGDLDVRRRASIMAILAHGYRRAGDLEAAIRAGTDAVALYRAADAELESAIVLNDLSMTYLALGDVDRAATLVAEARDRAVTARAERLLSDVLDTEARIALARGEVEVALERATAAVSGSEAAGNRKGLSAALVTRGKALVAAGRAAEATASYERAADLAREHGPRSLLQQILGEWAEVLAGLGQHARAYALTREALGGAPEGRAAASTARVAEGE